MKKHHMMMMVVSFVDQILCEMLQEVHALALGMDHTESHFQIPPLSICKHNHHHYHMLARSCILAFLKLISTIHLYFTFSEFKLTLNIKCKQVKPVKLNSTRLVSLTLT